LDSQGEILSTFVNDLRKQNVNFFYSFYQGLVFSVNVNQSFALPASGLFCIVVSIWVLTKLFLMIKMIVYEEMIFPYLLLEENAILMYFILS